MLSHAQLFVTPWTVAHQGILSIELSRQEYWSGLVIPFSRASSWPRNRTGVSCIADRFFTSWATREAQTPGYLMAKKITPPRKKIPSQPTKFLESYIIQSKEIDSCTLMKSSPNLLKKKVAGELKACLFFLTWKWNLPKNNLQNILGNIHIICGHK